jgi:hypothetical protein
MAKTRLRRRGTTALPALEVKGFLFILLFTHSVFRSFFSNLTFIYLYSVQIAGGLPKVSS